MGFWDKNIGAKEPGRATIAQVACDLKEKIIMFCEEYKIPKTQQDHLISQYTKRNPKTPTKYTHSILANVCNKIDVKISKTHCINKIISIFLNISKTTAYRLYNKPEIAQQIIDPLIHNNKSLKNAK